MRKPIISLLALTLILTMTLPLFAACGEKEQGTETDTKAEQTTMEEVTPESTGESLTEEETVPFPYIEEKDYGKDFVMWFSIAKDGDSIDYYWVEENKVGGNAMSEAVYARQEQVRAYLGVEIYAKSEVGDSQVLLEPFRTAVKNKDNSVQMFRTSVFGGLPSLVSEGYFTAYEDMPEIDMYAPYWSTSVMEELAIEGKTYLGQSRFNILQTYVVAYNKDMMAKYADVMEGTVYDMVDSYEWTLDKMISLAKLVYIDNTGDGKTKDDSFGLSANTNKSSIGFLHASDINVVEQNEQGKYELTLYNGLNAERTVSIIERLQELQASDYAWMKDAWADEGANIYLHTGRVLMSWEATTDLDKLTSYELSFGVLPYPMYDEAQKDVGYRHLQWGGYIAIPAYLEDRQMVGETVEMLSYYSTAVNEVYYEKMLGKQVADMPEDARMLDLVWNTVCSDFCQTYCELGSTSGKQLLYIVSGTLNGNAESVATIVARYENSFMKALEKFQKVVKKLNEK